MLVGWCEVWYHAEVVAGVDVAREGAEGQEAAGTGGPEGQGHGHGVAGEGGQEEGVVHQVPESLAPAQGSTSAARGLPGGG